MLPTAVDPSSVQARAGGPTHEPPARESAQVQRTLHRRRVLLAALLVAALVSLGLALVTGRRPSWALHGAADALLLSYLAVLIHFRNTAAEHEMARRELSLSS